MILVADKNISRVGKHHHDENEIQPNVPGFEEPRHKRARMAREDHLIHVEMPKGNF